MSHGGQANLSDLAKACRITTSAITGAVDVLEKRQLMGREHCEEDRRKIFTFVTPKGKKLLEQVASEIQASSVN
jgi:DNA-binding MarR family transcriptional regulator